MKYLFILLFSTTAFAQTNDQVAAVPEVKANEDLICTSDLLQRTCKDSSGKVVFVTGLKSPSEKVQKGQVCFNECKRSGGFLGLVGGKSGFERPYCEPCMRKNPEVYSFCPDVDGNEIIIAKGDTCYDECKQTKGFLGLGIGKKKVGMQRLSCAQCMASSNNVTPMILPSYQKDEINNANCTISADKQYAVCHGDTYKLDTSISADDRSSGKEVHQSHEAAHASPGAKAE